MADRKISDLTALTAPAAGDYLPIVDISEVSAANKNKRITIEELLRGAPDGTAAAPSIGFESDPNTGIYRPGADALGLVTGGTERLRITSAGLVGIGTSSPSVALDVVGQIKTSLLFNANGEGFIRGDTAGELTIQGGTSGTAFRNNANNTTRLYITDAGLVGIGTASPTSLLHLSASALADLRFTDTGEATDQKNWVWQTGTGIGAGTFRLRVVNDANSTGENAYIVTRSGASVQTHQWLTAGTERARIDSSGRLLVGTSSARSNFFGSQSAAFQVEGNLGVGSVGQIISHVYGESAALGGPYFVLGKHRSGSIGGATLVASNDQLGAISFTGADGTNFIEGARIQAFVDGTPGSNDMPGRLVFSTTADGASSPTERMRIESTGRMQHTSSIDSLYLGSTQGAGTAYAFILGVHSRTGPQTGGTNAFLVYTNGNVENTNNSYAGISDIKLKENIVDATSQWSDIKALQVRKYNFKQETGQQTHTQIGLIAQEVELVSPGLVSESPDRDAEGNDLGTVTKSVNYSVLYMKAVKALQEAMERIETLEVKVAALESA